MPARDPAFNCATFSDQPDLCRYVATATTRNSWSLRVDCEADYLVSKDRQLLILSARRRPLLPFRRGYAATANMMSSFRWRDGHHAATEPCASLVAHKPDVFPQGRQTWSAKCKRHFGVIDGALHVVETLYQLLDVPAAASRPSRCRSSAIMLAVTRRKQDASGMRHV
jgi:hypothetical protein